MSTELSRRERKKEETRERIFKAAIELFRTRGFESTTVDEITERADVAKGTFFNYFPRKDAVLAYLSESRFAALQENAGAILAGDKSAREKLLDLYAQAATAYESDRELSRYVLVELMSRAFLPTEDVGTRWQELTAGVIRAGQERGELRRDLDPIRVEALLTNIYYATLYGWVCCPAETQACSPFQFELQDELRARLELAFDGIAAR